MSSEKSGAGQYRFGFNGKEQDPEVKGPDNQYDYGMRMYDPRVAKFLSVDPLTRKYPWYTPYQYAGNMPTSAVDLDGMEINPTGVGGLSTVGIGAETWLAERAAAGDAEAARDYRIIQNAKLKVSEAQLLLAATAYSGGALSLAEGASLRTVLINMAKLGTAGLIVNGTISLAKGEEGYNLIKASVSGFFSGAMLGLPWAKSLEGIISAGFMSGSINEFSDQTFDFAYGIDDGYNLKEIMQSGGIGAVANMIGEQMVNTLERAIDQRVAQELAKENSPSNIRAVKKLMRYLYPRAGNNQIKRYAKEYVEDSDNTIKKDAEAKKAALNQAIQRAMVVYQNIWLPEESA